MKKFILGLLIGTMMLVSTAFAGPVERKLHKEGYTKAVYDILVDHKIPCNTHVKEGDIGTTYGEGLAIGPHYILTAKHVISKNFFDNGRQIQTEVQKIYVLSKKGRMITANVVERGPGDSRENDWAIIHLSKSVKYWINPEISTVEVGDDVYNVCGNGTKWAGVYPMIVLNVDPEVLEVETGEDNTQYKVKEAKYKKRKVYIMTPRPQGGDSGTPVFDENGALIGIVVAGNERTTLVIKAKAFQRKVNKYRGQ